jgi:hypothetical protein
MSSMNTVRPKICRCRADLYFWNGELSSNGPGPPCETVGRGVAANRYSTEASASKHEIYDSL